jgi:hypothetical protein
MNGLAAWRPATSAPLDVAGLVISSAISTTECSSFRALAEQPVNVADKVPGIVPCITYNDSESPSGFEVFTDRVIAPSHHGCPGTVQRMRAYARDWIRSLGTNSALYLLRPGHPRHVARLVASAVVDPVKSQASGTATQLTDNAVSEVGKHAPVLVQLFRAPSHDTPPRRVQAALPLPVNISARVPVLLYACSPADFARLVIAIIINTIQCHTHRTRTDQTFNILYKELRVMPAIANRYTPATVIRKLLKVGVITAGHHIAPGAIQRVRPGQAVCPLGHALDHTLWDRKFGPAEGGWCRRVAC